MVLYKLLTYLLTYSESTAVNPLARVVQLHSERNVNCRFQTPKLWIRNNLQVHSRSVVATDTTCTQQVDMTVTFFLSFIF